MSWYLENIDFEQHNAEAREVWGALEAGRPIRVPVMLGTTPRIYLLNPELNTEHISFEDYSNDPDLMAHVQMRNEHYVRHHMLQDAHMGPPAEGWTIYPDLQNYYEAAWFGAEVQYREGQVPDTKPLLNSDNKRMLFDRGLPDPFHDGIMEKLWQYYEHMLKHKSDYSYAGLLVAHVNPSCISTDGPFTVAANLRGTTDLCTDIYEDPDYVHELLRYITEATIQRIVAFRKHLGQEPKPQSAGFCDDSIEILSVDMYREFVLPYHKMLIHGIAGDGPHLIHLCGDVDRLLPTIKSELKVMTWDAGFPMDYAAVRKALGPQFRIQTGPRVSTLLHSTPDEVEAETRRILESGITEGGQFVMRDANNLSPCTPVENVAAMYEATRKYGRF